MGKGGCGKGGWMNDKNRRGQKARNVAAVEEGRSIYVRGIPPDWTSESLHELFECHGKIESVNLLPTRQDQDARAAFVSFTAADSAALAAEACDDLSVVGASSSYGSKTYKLACSLKKKAGEKVAMISGFSDLSQARQEKRTLYMSGFPPEFTETKFRELCIEHGSDVEKVNLMPVSRNLSCFVILDTFEHAAMLIEKLDGEVIGGKRVSVNFPRPPKRTKAVDEKAETKVEIRGFSNDATSNEIQAVLESSGIEVHSVKILRHETIQESIALVYLGSIEDADDIVEVAEGLEYAPGWTLHASIISEDGYATGSAPSLENIEEAADAVFEEAPGLPPEYEQEAPASLSRSSRPPRPPKVPSMKFAGCTSRAPDSGADSRQWEGSTHQWERREASRWRGETPRPSARPSCAPGFQSSDWSASTWDEYEEPARKRQRSGKY